MKLALEISFYGFLFISLFGVFLLVMLFRWIFGEKDILASFPQTPPLPTPALDEAKKLLKKMREHLPNASTARRGQLLRDLDLMDRTVQEFEFRTNSRETNYRKLCEEREEVWKAVKEIVEKMSSWERLFGKKSNYTYIQALQLYKNLSQRIEDAAEHVKFQGEMLLAELRNRGVYQQNSYLLYPKKKQISAAEERKEGEAIPSEPQTPAHKEKQTISKEDQKTSEEEQNTLKKEETLPSKTDASPSVRPQLKQADFPKIGINLKKRKYVDPTFNIDFDESAILRHYDFEDCIFRGVNFTGLHQYDHCNFKQVDFTGARWFQVLQPHRFDHCDFSKANFSDCHFTFTAFYHCRFDLAQWSGIKFKKVKFVSCSLEGIQWHGMDLSRVVFSKDMFTALDFSNCAALPQNHPDRQKPEPPAPPQEAAVETSNPPSPSSIDPPAPVTQINEKKQDSQP